MENTSRFNIDAASKGGSLLTAIKNYLLEAFKEAGLEVDYTKGKKNKDGSITYKLKFKKYLNPEEESDNPEFQEFEYYVNGKPTDDSKKAIDLSFMYPDFKSDPSGKKMKEEIDLYTNVPNKEGEILKKVHDFLYDYIAPYIGAGEGEDSNVDFTASIDPASALDNYKLLNFTVDKVAASAGYKLKFSKIYANYSPEEVKCDIDAIAGDSEFLQSLVPNTPSQFGVLITDDDYNVEEFKEFEASDQALAEYIDIACNAILDQAYKLYCDSKFFSYAACGSDRERIMSLADSYGWRIQTIIDEMSRRLIEHGVYLYNPCAQIRRSQFPAVCENQCPHWGDFETVMREDIQDLLSVLNLYASNFPKDEEAQILEWIRSWTSELNYNLVRSSEVCRP